MLPGCGCEWCWCYPLRMRRVEIQISRRGHPIRASPKRLPNQHSTAPATLADHTDLRRRSTLYTTRHSTPIGAAKQPPYVVAQPPLNSLGLSWSKIIRLCSAYILDTWVSPYGTLTSGDVKLHFLDIKPLPLLSPSGATVDGKAS